MIVTARSALVVVMAAATDGALLVLVLTGRMVVCAILVPAGPTGFVVVTTALFGVSHAGGPPSGN